MSQEQQVKTVQLKLSEKSLIEALRHGFTSDFTFLGELIQNARRAEASEIRFDLYQKEDKLELRVSNDGKVIDDLQNLFTIGQTGWDETIVEKEKPFGVGFLSALFSCDNLSVYSGEYAISTSIDELLTFQPLEITSTKPICQNYGTRLELKGVFKSLSKDLRLDTERPKHYIDPDVDILNVVERVLTEYSIGSSVRVYLNQKRLEDKESVTQLQKHLVQSETFQYYFNPNGTRVSVYLLGSPIGHGLGVHLFGLQSHVNCKTKLAIHLDPSKYQARFPDRTQLVNQDEESKKIYKEICGEIYKIYEAKLNAGEIDEIINSYELLKNFNCLKLFNSIPFIPCQLLRRFTFQPDFLECTEFYHSHSYGSNRISKEELEEKGIYFIDIDQYEIGFLHYTWLAVKESFNVTYGTTWNREKNISEIDKTQFGLDKDHWIHNLIKTIDTETEVSYRLNNPIIKARWQGNWSDVDVQFCESYFITVAGEEIEVTDRATSIFKDYEAQLLILPENINSDVLDLAVGLVSPYNSDDTFQEDSYWGDKSNFLTFVNLNRQNGTTEDTIKTLLKGTLKQVPKLFNKEFYIQLDDTGDIIQICDISNREEFKPLQFIPTTKVE